MTSNGKYEDVYIDPEEWVMEDKSKFHSGEFYITDEGLEEYTRVQNNIQTFSGTKEDSRANNIFQSLYRPGAIRVSQGKLTVLEPDGFYYKNIEMILAHYCKEYAQAVGKPIWYDAEHGDIGSTTCDQMKRTVVRLFEAGFIDTINKPSASI